MTGSAEEALGREIDQAIASSPFTKVQSPNDLTMQLTREGQSFSIFESINPVLMRGVVPVVQTNNYGVVTKPLGTAFATAKLPDDTYVFATAAHNVRGVPTTHPRRTERTQLENVEVEIASAERAQALTCVVMPKGTDSVASTTDLQTVRVDTSMVEQDYEPPWPPIKAHSDVALLVATFPDDIAPPITWPLRVARPRIGTTCVALGYTRMELEEHSWRFQFASACGTITEIWWSKGDGVNDFPSFRTDAYYPSGLSGGPVIDEDGYVIGVVSNSWEPGRGHCSPLVALAELALETTKADGESRHVRFGDLLGTDAVSAVGEGFTISRSTEGVEIHWLEEG
jgi:hypothetical protein